MKLEHEDKSHLTFTKTLYSLIDNSPIGMLLLNSQTEVVYANEVMETYFEYFPENKSSQFGNLFNCQIVSNEENICGTKRQCSNCKIRNSIKNAIQHNRAIKDIKVHKTFIKNGITQNKWLDVAIVPIEIEDALNLVVYINDITESAKYQINLDMDALMLDENNNKEKAKFHENVLNQIGQNAFVDGQNYLMLIELDSYQPIKDTFGAIWANDYCLDFINYFYSLIESKDYACRYSENQVMSFIPHSKVDAHHYLDQISAYKYKYFTMKASIRVKMLRLTDNKKDTGQQISDEEIYLSYFKSISRLENALDNEVIEWEL